MPPLPTPLLLGRGHPSKQPNTRTMGLLVSSFLMLYGGLWTAVRPLLRHHKRLKEGFESRLVPSTWGEPVAGRDDAALMLAQKSFQAGAASLPHVHERPYDVWIQAASGGEAYLTLEILRAGLTNLHGGSGGAPFAGLRFFCSSCTRQGMDVLYKGLAELHAEHKGAFLYGLDYFPLDAPSLMRKALKRLFGPHAARLGTPTLAEPVLVLLETELWPGLLDASRESGIRVLVLNARMTDKSFRGYARLRAFFQNRTPWRVLATSEKDRLRFSVLFDDTAAGNDALTLLRNATEVTVPHDNHRGVASPEARQPGGSCCGLMPNIKFDRLARSLQFGGIGSDACLSAPHRQYASATPGNPSVVALASVREEEEKLLQEQLPTLLALRDSHGNPVSLAIAPRHMHRVDAWVLALKAWGIPCLRRSCGENARPEAVFLWDTFGEVDALYARSSCVFVGGSLAPLGGQNFLEPLVSGLIPCIGPSWSNFYWVGQALFDQHLALRVETAAALPKAMQGLLLNAPDRNAVKTAFLRYLAPREGGSSLAALAICEALKPEAVHA